MRVHEVEAEGAIWVLARGETFVFIAVWVAMELLARVGASAHGVDGLSFTLVRSHVDRLHA